VRAGDVELTTVLTLLNTHGISTSTLVVYSSDHGSDGKFSTYEAGLRVPLIMRLPGVIPNGLLIHEVPGARCGDNEARATHVHSSTSSRTRRRPSSSSKQACTTRLR